MTSELKFLDNIEDDFVYLRLSDACAVPTTAIDVSPSIPALANLGGGLKDHPEHSSVFGRLDKHSNASRTDTSWVFTEAVKAAHPGSAVVATRSYTLGIFSFPEVRISRLGKTEFNSFLDFAPPAQRDLPGSLVLDIVYGCFTVQWAGRTYLMYVSKYTENQYMVYHQYTFVHEEEAAIQALVLASSTYGSELHEQIPVYAHGYWEKDHKLWLDVQKANWDDVILDAGFKKKLQDDVNGFFDSEEVYRELAIPWKRGIIFLGPPGNGKTISLKAIIKGCRHPSLYVKNFTSYMGEQFAMQEVFDYARRMSPCILVLEDLDSLINDSNRSFFLNQIDGLQGNDGLLVIGTTNHFDKLDPALSNRPSRFDRKFKFDLPTREERILYGRYWQNKLKKNKDIDFSERLLETVADLTEGFSFAYMKEAMVSTLVILATSTDRTFEEVLKEQIAALRKTIGDGNDE